MGMVTPLDEQASLRPLPSEQRRCSLVITSYNGLENLRSYLPPNLEAVKASAECDEVIVVDDGSSDGSVEYLRRSHPDVRVLALERNRGFGDAANAGFEAARNDWVVNISNDMVIGERFFEHLFDDVLLPDVFHVTARQVGPDGALQKGRTIPFFLGEFRIWKRFCREPAGIAGPPRRLYHHFCGAIGLYDRRVFRALGGFDPLYLPFFVEENDLCWRAWRRGYRVLYEPRAVVVHHHRTSGTIAREYAWRARKVQYRKNRLLFTWKNLSRPDRLVSHGLYLALLVGFSWLTCSTVFYRGLWQALGRLAEVRARRAEEAARAVRSDREIEAQFSRDVELPVAAAGGERDGL